MHEEMIGKKSRELLRRSLAPTSQILLVTPAIIATCLEQQAMVSSSKRDMRVWQH